MPDSHVVQGGLYTQRYYTVATLPPAASLQGERLFVTDATVGEFIGGGSIAVGGGTYRVRVYSDSSNWRIYVPNARINLVGGTPNGLATLGDNTFTGTQYFNSTLGFRKVTTQTGSGTNMDAIGIAGVSDAGSGGLYSGPVTFSSNGALMFGSLRQWVFEGDGVQLYSAHDGVGAGRMQNYGVAQWNSHSAAYEPFLTYRSRGASLGAQGAVQSGDVLYNFQFIGDDGVSAHNSYVGIAAQLDILVDGAVSVGVVPGRWRFKSHDTAGAEYTHADFRSDKSTALAGNLRASGANIRFDFDGSQTTTLENTTTPVGNGTLVATLEWKGYNRSGTSVTPAFIRGIHQNTVAGAPSGIMEFYAIKFGVGSTRYVQIDGDNHAINLSAPVVTTDSYKSAAPSGSTAGVWKLGAAASVSPTSPNRTVAIDIGGTVYYLAAKTTND